MTKFKLNKISTCLQVLVIIYTASSCFASLSDVLKHYETLHVNDINHRISKRSADGIKKVSFQALGRNFNLFLKSQKGLLSSSFRAVAVDGHGNEKRFAVDESSFYTGYDEDESHSSVQAYWEDDALSATIRTPTDVFVVEPSWRHLPASNNYSMIAYKGSDVKEAFDKNHPNHEGPSVCGAVNPPNPVDSMQPRTSYDKSIPNETQGERVKRAAFDAKKNACPLLLVADYRFFTEMGQNKLASATAYLIALIGRVDALYRRTEFEPGITNFGFEIKEIKVHTDWTKVAKKGDVHYNMENTGWQTKDLLEAFSDIDRTEVCLAHLFTAQAVGESPETSALGLSYIASIRQDVAGGICSRVYYQGSTPMYLNTGWSSSLNRAKRRILTSEADLVTTHEFGHNWGSEHDPDTDECSPSSFKGGKFIMYTYSVSGYETNNKIFSKCSRRSIAQVLKAKSSKCFKEASPETAYCGNAKIEAGEECDGGLEGQTNTDKCCTSDCTLRQSAVCSDVNHRCCHECQFAPATEICYLAMEDDLACEGNSTCSGDGPDCPTPKPKSDGSACFEEGECRGGVCRPFCEKHNKMPCICDNVTLSCLYCCRDAVGKPCKPYLSGNPPRTHFLPDGKPCLQGFCNNTGVCMKQSVDLVNRLWDIITDLSFSDIVAFMRANIVGTIIIFSLIIWIPAACVVSHVDRKRRQKEERKQDFFKPEAGFHFPTVERHAVASEPRRRPLGGVVQHTTQV